MAKKRRSPRKRANTRQECEQQLARFEKLLTKWIANSVNAASKVDTYRKKVAYYQDRVNEFRTAEEQELRNAADAAQREHRAIDLDGGG